MNNTLSLRESVRYLSILVLVIVVMLYPDRLQFVLLISWISIIIIDGNVRYLPFDNKPLYFMRMTLYFLPFALPTLIFLNIKVEINAQTLIYCAVSVIAFCVWLLINFKSIKLTLSDLVIANAPKENKYVMLLRAYNAVGSTVCEELFFRSFMLSLGIPFWITILLSTVYFMLSHYTVPWGAQFSIGDIINQLIFGTISAFLFLLSGSILPSIVLHLLLNSPTFARMVRVYNRHYVRATYYDKLLSAPDNLNNLTL